MKTLSEVAKNAGVAETFLRTFVLEADLPYTDEDGEMCFTLEQICYVLDRLLLAQRLAKAYSSFHKSLQDESSS